VYKLSNEAFLKWAGGKTQLLEQLDYYLPIQLKNGLIDEYYEPFIGGGALYFYIFGRYEVQRVYLSDINEELILTYKVIQREVESLIECLTLISEKYGNLSWEKRRTFFHEMRTDFNAQRLKVNYKKYSDYWVQRASQFIFLNKTAYNGLFRVNSNGEFNVPFGRYKNPRILDENNLINVSKSFRIADIRTADFSELKPKRPDRTFVYFDPPYRPISKTAHFTSYNSARFTDKEQVRLAKYFEELDCLGCKLMLSNSDPKNENPDDLFFERLYKGYGIHSVHASRMINRDASGRKPIRELLVLNYEPRT
jgi:DNA adenine methylase